MAVGKILFIQRNHYWWHDLYFERLQSQNESVPSFVGWHDTVFSFPAAERQRYYAGVPSWRREIDASTLLTVSSPRVFAYYSDRVLNGTVRKSKNIWRISCSEWVVMTIMSFLAFCRDGANKGVSKDPSVTEGVIILPLTRHFV